MKVPGILLLSLIPVACGAAAGDTGDRHALKMEVNEALTISHLKSLVGAQVQAQSLQIIDVDEDKIGEFAFLLELAGQRKPRAPGNGLKFPLLGEDFRNVSSIGYVEVHGYLYRDFLPGADGRAVAGDAPPTDPAVSSDGAESHWLCYAWPAGYGTTGKLSFLVTSEGTLYAADLPGLSGRQAPEPGTAFVPGEGFSRAVRDEWQKVD